MTHLEILLRNPFADTHVTDTRLDGFTMVTRPKIVIANTGGRFDAILAEIDLAYPPFHTKLVNIETDLSLQIGKRVTRESVMAQFKHFVSIKKGVVHDKYEFNIPFYDEFYPNGMEDYNAAGKTDILILMERYSAAATLHSADFSITFVDAANAFPVTYAAAVDSQDTAIGHTGADRSTRNDLRDPLNSALYDALHIIAAALHGSVSAVKAIIDLNLLEFHPRRTIKHLLGEVAGNATVNVISENWDISYVIFLKNTGNADLRACLSPDATTACSSGDVVYAGTGKTLIITTLGPLTNLFLNITNLSLSTLGKYEIEIYRQ